MTIQKPKTFMGVPWEELLRQEEPETHDEQKPEIVTPGEIDGFVYVPEIKLYIYPQRVFTGLNYEETHGQVKNETLEGQKIAITTPYQFRAFLKLLRDSTDEAHKALFREITEVKDPWRGNWLNARFQQRKDGMYMLSQNVLEYGSNGKYRAKEEKLEDFLAKDKINPGISLDAWLNSKTSHGLPPANISDGKMYYWPPGDERVAWLGAYSDWLGLCCDWDPSDWDPSLGVFVCAEGAQKNPGGKRNK